MNPRGLPLPTVRRLPFYLRLFREEAEKGTLWISSDFLGDRLGLGAIQVRKDLSMVGAEGRARCGFPVRETMDILSGVLGGDEYADVFLIGSGPLAEAVLLDGSLLRHGFKVIAVFDPDPIRTGSSCLNHDILSMGKFPDLVRRMGINLAVFALSKNFPIWSGAWALIWLFSPFRVRIALLLQSMPCRLRRFTGYMTCQGLN
jgi:redox-sensing transcriptional repressor